MCDHAHYEELEDRLDDHEKRLTKIETSLDETKQIVREGFADIKATMHDAYAEKIAWGDWARHALTDCGKWVGKWGAIITAAAIGMGNIDKIANLFGG